MQYLLSKEEYDELVNAKELAAEQVRTQINGQLEAITTDFICSMTKALRGSSPYGVQSRFDYSCLLTPVREALAKLKV